MTINIRKEDVFKHLQFILIVIIFGLLLWSQPWQSNTSSEDARIIKVSGEATIEATPDEFVFYPYFEAEGADQEALKAGLTQQANDAVDRLKELGVSEDKIELDASSYDRWYWDDGEDGILTASLTITVNDREMAQEVQDYLLTLDIKGQLTPQGVFSKAKQKELDAQAVEEASKDARSKAETQAELFGAKLGKVVTVEQGLDSLFPIALESRAAIAEDEPSPVSSLPVLPGQNDYTQTVTVTYELK